MHIALTFLDYDVVTSQNGSLLCQVPEGHKEIEGDIDANIF